VDKADAEILREDILRVTEPDSGFDVESLRRGLPWLRQQARASRAREAHEASRAQAFERLVETIELILGIDSEPIEPTEKQLRGGEAALTVMREQDRQWTARQVHEELERRGWVSPDARHPLRGTEAAINRLWRAGEIEKLGRGRYRAKP
jgi:hypothetical protein